MSKTTKAKSLITVFLSVVMALCLVCGITMNQKQVLADETTTTKTWEFSNPKTPLVDLTGSSGIYKNTYPGATINNVNVLDMPNRTVSFQFMLSNKGQWTAFCLLNGKDGWTSVHHVGHASADAANSDKFPHLILDVPTQGAQLHPGASDGSYAPHQGVNGLPADLTDQLHTFEFHIGTGTDGDISYVKIDGSQLGTQADAKVSLYNWVTPDLFPNGCYIVFGAGGVAENCVMLFGEYNAPYVTNISSGLAQVDLSQGEAPEGLSFIARNVQGTATFKVNGVEVTDASTYTAEAVEGGTKYTLNASFWTVYMSALKKSSALTVEGTNGKGAVAMTVQLAAPPVWDGDSYKEINSSDSLSYRFTYTGKTYTAEDVIVKTGVSAASTQIAANTDYTLTKDGTTYTLAFTQEYLAKAFETYRSFKFTVTLGEDSLTGSVYCKPAAEGWYARSVDLASGELTTSGYYTSGNMNVYSAGKLSTRLVYNKALDVTKPITLEFSAVDVGTTWAMLAVHDTQAYNDYFSDGTANDSMLQALFFGGRTDIQRLAGFVAEASTNAHYPLLSEVKNIVVEMYFGATAEEGYFRINGVNCGTPSKTQADFRDGKAYIGFFFARQNGQPFDFTVNKDVNGIAITGPVDTTDKSKYSIDLAKPVDLTLNLINTDGTSLKVTSSSGVESAADDLAYENGKLTIKASYFAKLAFAKAGFLQVEDTKTGTGTAIALTYSSSNMGASVLAFAKKGALADTELTLGSDIATVNSVMKNDEALAAELWSFANGKLTIKKEAIADEVGANEFFVVSGNKIIPAYVYVNEFTEDGYAKSGAGKLETGNGAYLLTNENALTFMKAYDLTEGVSFKIDFKSTIGYIKDGLDQQGKNGYVKFTFFDPYSGCTLYVTIYTNYEASEIAGTNYALYMTYSVVKNDGSYLVEGMQLPININKSENKDPLGVHVVKIKATGTGIGIKIDSAREQTITDDLGTFNLTSTILTVSVPDKTAKAEMILGLQEYAYDAAIDYTAIEVTKKPDTSESTSAGEFASESTSGSASATESVKESAGESKKSGCKSGLGATGVLALAALAGVVALRKKKEN